MAYRPTVVLRTVVDGRCTVAFEVFTMGGQSLSTGTVGTDDEYFEETVVVGTSDENPL